MFFLKAALTEVAAGSSILLRIGRLRGALVSTHVPNPPNSKLQPLSEHWPSRDELTKL